MNATYVFFRPDDAPEISRDAIESALALIPGLTFDAPPGAFYRPARWLDLATGARTTWDVGRLDLHGDDGPDHPTRTYPGWVALPLELQIPLAGPHWQAVTALATVDTLLRALPGITPLDCEDICRDEDSEPGPFPWDRPRAIASWERQREAQAEGLTIPRMERRASIALWRYRVETARGRLLHQDLHWPAGMALFDREAGQACSACLWNDPGKPLALPPVDLVAVPGGCFPADDLRALADPSPLPGGAVAIPVNDAVRRFHAGLWPFPVARFQGLGDEDWRD